MRAIVGWFLVGIGACGPSVPSHAPVRADDARGSASGGDAPWAGWVKLGAEESCAEVLTRCPSDHSDYWSLTTDVEGRAAVRKSAARAEESLDPLPTPDAPKELSPGVPGTRRRVLEGREHWLIALNSGEWGGGLFSLAKHSGRLHQEDHGLAEAVRWIERFEFGVIGVAGLCHGEGCTRHSFVYRISEGPSGWTTTLLAELEGCPLAVAGRAGGREALLLTCRAVHLIDAKGVTLAASWGPGLIPISRPDAVLRDLGGALYVSFGPLIGKFGPGAPPEWRAPTSCAGTRKREPT